jgi:hypothetical protein
LGAVRGRVLLFRPVWWDDSYDPVGRSVVGPVRRLAQLRKAPHFRRGTHDFHDDPDRYQRRGVPLFSRELEGAWSLVALTFGDEEQWVPFAFPRAGAHREELHPPRGERASRGGPGQERWVCVPRNSGRVWTSAG